MIFWIYRNILTVGMIAAFALMVSGNPAFALSRAEVKKIVVEEAQNSSVPPALALAVAKVESDFNPTALSTAGARGVMQIMPKTAKAEFGVDEDELWQARLNIQLGIDYLAKLRRQYGGNWDLALSHYNGGTLKGRGGNAQPHTFTRNYVRMVRRWQQRYAEQNRVWAIAFNDAKPLDQDEERWKQQSRIRWDGGRYDSWAPLDGGQTSHRYTDGRLFAAYPKWDNCQKSSHQAPWREYDQFSIAFNRDFGRRFASSNSRSRISWRRTPHERSRRIWRSAKKWRDRRPYDRVYNGFSDGFSTLESRRLRAARSLDDFSS